MLGQVIKSAGLWSRLLVGPLSLWLMSLTSDAWAQGSSEKRVALVIGNAAYASSPLTNPTNDAADLSAALRRLGFEVLERHNRNSEELKRDLIEFQDKLGPGVVGLFYFAGHGVQAGRGLNYLLPVGVEFRRERDAELFGLEAGTVLRRIEESGAALSVVILDACRDSPLPSEGRTIGSRGLSRMDAPSGSLIAFATAAGSTADENRGSRNGLYTQFLLSAIETPGLRLEDVFQEVRRGVERASNRRQSPEEVSKLTSTFYFRPPVSSTLTAPSAISQPRIVVPSLSLTDLEREQQTRREWEGWQRRMQADFDRISQFQGAADLRAQAWQRFLDVWKDQNPNSPEDDRLRVAAQQFLSASVRDTKPEVTALTSLPVEGSKAPTQTTAHSDVSKSVFGIRASDLSEVQRAGNSKGGITVEAVDGPAAKAGLREGDVILSVDNTQVTDLRQFGALAAKVEKSRAVSVLVRRGAWVNYYVIRPSQGP